jgi:hypothetical protein
MCIDFDHSNCILPESYFFDEKYKIFLESDRKKEDIFTPVCGTGINEVQKINNEYYFRSFGQSSCGDDFEFICNNNKSIIHCYYRETIEFRYKINNIIFTYSNNHASNYIYIYDIDTQKTIYDAKEGRYEHIYENCENMLKNIIGDSVNYKNILNFLQQNPLSISLKIPILECKISAPFLVYSNTAN